MCDWWPLIIFCGCRHVLKPVKKPPKNLKKILSDPSTRLYCTACSRQQPIGCYRYWSWFTLFMIPLFPYRLGKPFIACEFCKRPVDFTAAARICRRCGVYQGDMTAGDRFCPTCGTEQ